MTSNQIHAYEAKKKAEHDFASRQENARANRAKEKLKDQELAIQRSEVMRKTIMGNEGIFPFLNHFEWYGQSKEQAIAVGSLPFQRIGGAQRVSFGVDKSGFSDARVCVIEYVDTLPICPTAKGLSNPINLAAQRVFSEMRAKNSGSKNYESADYMMYILGVGSLYSLYAYLCKIYAICNSVTPDTIYQAKAKLRALNLNWDSIIGNLTVLQMLINQLAAQIQLYALPKKFSYYDRKLWLISNTFATSNKPGDSHILFKPSGFFFYHEGGLTYDPFAPMTNEPWSIDTIRTYVDVRLAQTNANQTWAIMSGDTERAFESKIYKFPMINNTLKESIVFDMDVLRQIQNGNIAPKPLALTISQITDPESSDYGLITQGVSGDLDYTNSSAAIDYTYTPRYGLSGNANKPDKFDPYATITNCIVSDEEKVSHEDVFRMTRFKTIFKTVDSAKNNVQYLGCGTEILTGIYFPIMPDGKSWQISGVGTPLNVSAADDVHDVSTLSPDTTSNLCLSLNVLTALTNNFYYIPYCYAYVPDYDLQNGAVAYHAIPYKDHQYLRVYPLDTQTLGNINLVAFSSMMGLYSK